MSLVRVAFFYSFSSQGHSLVSVLPSFVMGLRYDLRCVGLLFLLLLLLGSINAFDPFRRDLGRKLALFLIGLSAFLLTFFYSIDFSYYSYLKQRLNASVLNYLEDAGISANMVWQTYPVLRILLLWIAGTWAIYFLCRIVYRRIARDHSHTPDKRLRITWIVAVALLAGLGIWGRPGQFPIRWSDAFALGSDYNANLALNPFQSFVSSLEFRHSTYDSAKVVRALPLLRPFFGFRQTDSLAGNLDRELAPRTGSLTTRPNVVLVICESFSGYKSSMWGNPLNTTPFFDGMFRNGLFFDHCFTPSYGTARGVWAVVTGIPDVAAGGSATSSRNPNAVDQHCIINDFEGYSPFYFLGGSTSWANIRGLLKGNIKGLHLFEQEDYDAPKIDVWGISDKNLFLEANKVLRQQTSPFFAIIQTADNHRPYTIPKEDQEAFPLRNVATDSLRRFGFESNAEMNAFRYTDFGYRTFIETASKEKYFDNTIFLFIGDHGIPGDAGQMLPRAWTDQRLTAEHVPLLIYSPKLIHPRRDSGVCSQVDVLPTLAGLCGVPYRNTTFGRDLLDTAARKDKDLAFIYDFDQGYIGIIRDDYFYRRQAGSGKEEMVPVRNNNPVPAAVFNDRKASLRALTEGFYETAKYMLLNNKKKDGK
ncbi:MAG: sulfatase-like hydrolase/transferase [Bacteroidota bacterium]|nr:sulfatase-like hydrolase/transferase [Bacteroidota bacterium]